MLRRAKEMTKINFHKEMSYKDLTEAYEAVNKIENKVERKVGIRIVDLLFTRQSWLDDVTKARKQLAELVAMDAGRRIESIQSYVDSVKRAEEFSSKNEEKLDTLLGIWNA